MHILMEHSYMFNEVITNNFNYNFLNVLFTLSISSGILVIISRNPVVSVLFLIGLFITIASYLMALGINFIGLSYLLVYVGAVSILFLFILMLINVRISELVVDSINSIPLAIMISIFFGFVLNNDLFNRGNKESNMDSYSVFQTNFTDSASINNDYGNIFSEVYNNNIFFVCSQVWDGRLAETFHITSIGNIIYTNFPLWLILTSVILLLAMIGSILITIKE